MKANTAGKIPIRRIYYYVTLAFIMLAMGQQLLMWQYWNRTLEPRLRREADSQAKVLAHSQTVKLAEVLSLSAPGQLKMALIETLDELLLFTEPGIRTPFFLGIDIDVDYEAVPVPPGSLDLSRGVPECSSCFVSEVALYSLTSDELLAIARFRVSDNLFQRLRKDVKRTLFTQSSLVLTLLVIVWGVVMLFIREINRTRQKAEIANRAKSTFLANMSHELRTPLNAIIGFSQMMGHDGGLAAKHKKNLEIINRSGEYLLELINDVLELSRIDAGQPALKQETIDLHDTLEKVMDMIRLRAERKNIRLNLEGFAAVPRYIETDGRKLRQILLNLLGNAVKFTERGAVTLRLATENESVKKSASEAADGGLRVCFAVEDTGPGISSAEREKIFDVFTQTKSGQSKNEGVGLGLAISRQFVRQLGGEIEVESQVGRGTVFRFTILTQMVRPPLPEAASAEQRVVGIKADPAEMAGPPYRILVVDDNPDNRTLLSTCLTRVGFAIKEAENGRVALEQCRLWKPHLIWMDMRMPVMDGYEATERILALSQSWPPEERPVIIALTASAFKENRAAVLSIGCHDFVRRPFRETEIFEKIRQHLKLEYIYAPTTPEPFSPEKAGEPSLENLRQAIGNLDDTLVQELRKATELSDMERIDHLVTRIGADHKPIAQSLKHLVDTFQYDRILALLGDAPKIEEKRSEYREES